MTRLISVRRSLAAAAVTPLLLAGLAACGDDSSGAADDSAHDDSAHAAVLTGLTKGDRVDPDDFVDTVADGVKESTTAHVTMKVESGSSSAMSGEGDLDYTSSPPSTAMTMTVPGAGEMKMIMVDGIIYLQAGQMSGGKYWKIDPSDPDGMFAKMGMDKLLDQADPVGGLKSMETGIDSVTYEGDEDVNGRDLGHYELSMDMQAVLDEMGGKLPEAATKALPDTVTYDLWLDDEDRFAQMKMEYPLMGQTMGMEMTLDDWGTDVDIEAPPAGEVTEMPSMDDLMGDAGGSSTMS